MWYNIGKSYRERHSIGVVLAINVAISLVLISIELSSRQQRVITL